MNWVFCISLFFIGCIKHYDAALIASSIFGIGGAIEILSTKFSKK